MEKLKTYNPCDECLYGIDRRDGSGSDRMCKICEFKALLDRRPAPENKPLTWIAVNKRLPESDGTYIVYAPTYNSGSSSSLDCVSGIMFCRYKHGKWSIEHGYYKRPNCVTHWLPLPSKPEEGTK